MSFPPSCTFFIRLFLRNYRKMLHRWPFILFLKCIQFFYPNSVSSFPGDSELPLVCPLSEYAEPAHPIKLRTKLGTLHCMGDLCLITKQMHTCKHEGTLVLCKVFDLPNLSKDVRDLI